MRTLITATGLIVIGLETPQSAGENVGYTCKLLGALATVLEAPTTSIGEPGSAGDKFVTTSNNN
jgi:hypothetical protein